jgi:hypothetical protein
MRGDYSRLRFKPGNDYAGVLMQQGRVQLDADFNEQTELLGRRLRVGSMDVFGGGAVPRETPDGFRIELSGGSLTIGRGRAYVGGLSAENHGGGKAEFDPSLAEMRGNEPVAFEKQPYRPGQLDLPTKGTHLVYLDVWERELTHLGEPGLVEEAVASDTSTRLQTVWQVKLVEVDEGADCDQEDERWKAQTKPSAGRLTTNPHRLPVPDEPCTVPSEGSYRGTENRLYRVEVHDPGPLGEATFKWSRDNGSVASPVTEVDASCTVLTLAGLGRDGAQRLRPGDWVEVSDDHRELAGLPGEMRRVEDVEEETQTVTLAEPLPKDEFYPVKADRHTRIVRWDGSGPEVDAGGGLLKTSADPDKPLRLGEDGVEIVFGAEGDGGFRSGDWWAFAARSASARVDELDAEPPRGVHHHYLRLALVDFSNDVVTDCRTLWPPRIESGGGCECTVCVNPEEHKSGAMTIQMAVDLMSEVKGGKICLEPGMYSLDEPVQLHQAFSVRIEGKGLGTVLTPGRGLPAFVVSNCHRIAIEDLAVHTGSALRDREKAAKVAGGLTGVAIVLRDSTDVTIERCELNQIYSESHSGPLIGLLANANRIRIRDNAISGAVGIAALVSIGRDYAEAPPGEALRAAATFGYRLATVDVGIEDNSVRCSRAGVVFPVFTWNSGPIRVVGNTFVGGTDAAVAVDGVSGVRASYEVARNSISAAGDGIVVKVDDARIADNDILASAGESTSAQSGIVLARGASPGGIARCMVVGNRIVGRAGEGISIRGSVKSASIEGNAIEQMEGAGISMNPDASAGTLTIARNRIVDVAPKVDRHGAAAGIRLVAAGGVSMVDNTVDGVGSAAGEGRLRYGIRLAECGDSRIAGNDVADIGPDTGFTGSGYGIGVIDPLAGVEVVDNAVCRRRVPPSEPNNDRWNTLAVLSHHPEERGEEDRPDVLAEVVRTANVLFPLEGGRDRPRAVGIKVLRSRGLDEFTRPSHVSVTGNRLDAYGFPSCAVVWGSRSVVFAHNRCVLAGNSSQPVAWIEVPEPPVKIFAGAWASIAPVVDGNHFSGPSGTRGLFVRLPQGHSCTVLGNISSGPIHVNEAPLVSPWAGLNG